MRYRIHAEGWPVPIEVEADSLWDALYGAGRFSVSLAETVHVTRVEVHTIATGWMECRP